MTVHIYHVDTRRKAQVCLALYVLRLPEWVLLEIGVGASDMEDLHCLVLCHILSYCVPICSYAPLIGLLAPPHV